MLQLLFPSFTTKTLYNVISYPLLSHNLLFTFETVMNERGGLHLLCYRQIIKANFTEEIL